MKTKKLNKLSLKKATVVNLNANSMRNVLGGDVTDTCPSLCEGTCKPLECNGSLECVTPASELSYCDCTTVDIECPTGNPPVC